MLDGRRGRAARTRGRQPVLSRAPSAATPPAARPSMATPIRSEPDTPAPPAGESTSRPASLWPDTTRLPRNGRSAFFEVSAFDPLHEQEQRERERLSSQFDLCRPALGLRVMIFVQLVVAVATLPASVGWVDW